MKIVILVKEVLIDLIVFTQLLKKMVFQTLGMYIEEKRIGNIHIMVFPCPVKIVTTSAGPFANLKYDVENSYTIITLFLFTCWLISVSIGVTNYAMPSVLLFVLEKVGIP